MDLSVFFAGTAGSVPTARRGLPATLLRAGGDRCCSTAARAPSASSLRSVGLPELDAIFLTHFHADHWLGLPGMLKTFDLRGRERPLDRLRPARACRRCSTTLRPRDRAHWLPARARRARAARGGRASTATVIAPFAVKHRRRGLRLRARRGRPARALRRRRARALGVAEGPDFGGCSAARRSTASRPSRSSGEARAGPADRALRRHRAVPGASRCSRTAPTCSSTRRPFSRTSARARARPATRRARAGRRARPRRRASGCSRSPTSPPATSRARSATRPARCSPSTVVPRDFDAIEVPFPERGEPDLVKRRSASRAPASSGAVRRLPAARFAARPFNPVPRGQEGAA